MPHRLLLLAASLWATGVAVAQQPVPPLVLVADCSRAAADAAAETGGRVLTVSSRNQDGRAVCVVTVLIPADGGGRPRRKTVVVPQ